MINVEERDVNDSGWEGWTKKHPRKTKVLNFKRPELKLFLFWEKLEATHEPGLQSKRLKLSLTKHNKIK